ncbi:MAG: polysaccharide export protein [Acidobacteria bacterium]|nr:polysaccharide export protein [Acidobacteriota bacterium]
MPIKGLVWVLCLAWAANAQTPGFTPREPRYRIQPNDVVEIQFRYTPEYNLTGTVQPDGFITIQVVGDVKVGGLTLAEASAAIAKLAGARLRDPEVTVLLKDFVKPHFVVAGEVTRPGTYEIRGEVTAIQAIAMSGGFKESSKRTQVILLRRVNPDYAEVKILDLKRLMSPGNIREDIRIRPDDMLVVPQNKVSRVEPLVRIGSMGLYGLALAFR